MVDASTGASPVPVPEDGARLRRDGGFPMRTSHPTSLSQELAATYDQDRYRGIDRRNVQHRALLASRSVRPSLPTRLAAAFVRVVRRDRPVTDYPCRLPDGKIGRTAVVQRDGEWTLVCRVA
jgi:hypothetical protein